jgi:hypothetical protein
MNRIQISNVTSYNRYPAIFRRAQKLSKSLTGKLNICSFGSSTGEEVLTLKEKYFQDHDVFGCEINESNLAKSRELTRGIIPDGRLVSEFSMLKYKFDFVFAMSVFCRWTESGSLNNLRRIYSFEQFESDMIELRDKIKIGGFLVLHNTNYYFEDTKTFGDFTGIRPLSTSKIFGSIPRFDTNGDLLPSGRTKEGFHSHTIRPGYVFFRRLK